MRCRCVTIDGDVLEPHGVMSGGYIDNSNMIL